MGWKNTIQNFILKYGNQQGTKRYNQFREKISIARKGKHTGPVKDKFIKKYGYQEGNKLYQQYCSKIGTSLQSFIRRYGNQQGTKRYNQFREKVSIGCKGKNTGPVKDRFIKKYGYQEGNKLYQQWLLKCQQSLQGFKRRYGDKQGEIRYNKFKQKSLQTKQTYIKRYGRVEGKIKWEQRIKNIKASSKRTLQYWLKETDGDYYEAKEKLRLEQSRSYQWFKRRYGQKQGMQKFQLRRKKQKESLKKTLKNKKIDSPMSGSRFGASAMNFFNELLVQYGGDYDAVIFGNKEKKIETQNGHYFVDFYIEKQQNNFIIEYYGDFWHANPLLYDQNYYHPILECTAIEIQQKDKKRLNEIKNKGFNVHIVWQRDSILKRKETIQECVNLIRENLNGNNKDKERSIF